MVVFDATSILQVFVSEAVMDNKKLGKEESFKPFQRKGERCSFIPFPNQSDFSGCIVFGCHRAMLLAFPFATLTLAAALQYL
jgi:hypothetical protein